MFKGVNMGVSQNWEATFKVGFLDSSITNPLSSSLRPIIRNLHHGDPRVANQREWKRTNLGARSLREARKTIS